MITQLDNLLQPYINKFKNDHNKKMMVEILYDNPNNIMVTFKHRHIEISRICDNNFEELDDLYNSFEQECIQLESYV